MVVLGLLYIITVLVGCWRNRIVIKVYNLNEEMDIFRLLDFYKIEFYYYKYVCYII